MAKMLQEKVVTIHPRQPMPMQLFIMGALELSFDPAGGYQRGDA